MLSKNRDVPFCQTIIPFGRKSFNLEDMDQYELIIEGYATLLFHVFEMFFDNFIFCFMLYAHTEAECQL